MQEQQKPFKYFDDGSNFCWLSFFVLGNYFAIFGLLYTSKALTAWNNGDLENAQKLRKKSRAWAIWGLIPSTIINIAIIWWCVKLVIENIEPFIQQLSQK